MTTSPVLPYGTWPSPISAELVSTAGVGLGWLTIDGDDLYWQENRPVEAGRSVVVRRDAQGQIADVTPAPFSVRSRLNEYGGLAYTVVDGTVYFANLQDQRLYRQAPGGTPEPITPEGPWRYAEPVSDRARGRLICLREDHSAEGEPVNTLVAVDMAGAQAVQVLAEGYDFYAAPRLSPDGTQLAWLAWSHPNMPWDGTELWVAQLDAAGAVVAATKRVGGADESIFQPEWGPDGALYFISDRSGWWNPYRWHDGQTSQLVTLEAEFGGPLWNVGTTTYGFDTLGHMLCAVRQNGSDRLASIDLATGAISWIGLPYTRVALPQVATGQVLFIGATVAAPAAVVRLNLATGQTEELARSSTLSIDPNVISVPEPIDFPTEDGLVAHGLFYPPRNRDLAAPAGEHPPLLVLSHGGPTAEASPTLDLRVQYWTSRGFAVLDVNYGGSTGYGRAYRERLNGQWGVVDVDDCINGARYLVAQGRADPARLIIRGGSAGGYTTLCALTFRDVFKAGASYFGISDLEVLDQDGHKFESRYNQRLIGPYPAQRELYRARSPLHFADQLSCPIIFFQGADDAVVPPNQAELMVDAMREHGLPVVYMLFAGEGHGFRRAETIMATLEAELSFYGQVFGFTPADTITPVVVENL